MQQLDHNTESRADVRVRVSVILQRPEDNKLCLVRHFKNNKRYWLLPGGGQDAMEPAIKTAQRELYEELRLTASHFELAFVRESMNPQTNRHIQFLVFKAIIDDFSRIAKGDDKRVEGYDFFSADELADITIYPAMKEDIIDFARGNSPQLFKTLDWIP